MLLVSKQHLEMMNVVLLLSSPHCTTVNVGNVRVFGRSVSWLRFNLSNGSYENENWWELLIIIIIIKFVTKVFTDTDIHNMLQDNVRDWDEEQDFRPN
jgi:hypothetical protein